MTRKLGKLSISGISRSLWVCERYRMSPTSSLIWNKKRLVDEIRSVSPEGNVYIGIYAQQSDKILVPSRRKQT